MKLCLYTYLEVIFLRMIKFAGLGYKCLQRGADWGSEKWIENGIIHFHGQGKGTRESCVFMDQYGNNIVFGTQVCESRKTSVNVKLISDSCTLSRLYFFYIKNKNK